MSSKDWNVCSECGRQMQRCRATSLDYSNTIMWVCRQCWRDHDYDRFLYEHRQSADQKEQK